MKLNIEGKEIEFEPKSGAELYEIVKKTINDPIYNEDYDTSFSEFPATSEKQNYCSIETDSLLRRIEKRSQMDKQITAGKCEKILAVMACVNNEKRREGYFGNQILGAMVFYE